MFFYCFYMILCMIGLDIFEYVEYCVLVLNCLKLELVFMVLKNIFIILKGISYFFNWVLYVKIEGVKELYEFVDYIKLCFKNEGIEI